MKLANIFKRLDYYRKNWKIGVHLTFRTYHFGVNNRWWGDWPSMFGWPISKRIWAILTVKPFLENYKFMKLRATAFCFLHPDEVKILGWDKWLKKEMSKVDERHSKEPVTNARYYRYLRLFAKCPKYIMTCIRDIHEYLLDRERDDN